MTIDSLLEFFSIFHFQCSFQYLQIHFQIHCTVIAVNHSAEVCWCLMVIFLDNVLLECTHKTDCLSLSCFLTPQTTAVSCSISSVARQKGRSDIRITDWVGCRLTNGFCSSITVRRADKSETRFTGWTPDLQVLGSPCIRKSLRRPLDWPLWRWTPNIESQSPHLSDYFSSISLFMLA